MKIIFQLYFLLLSTLSISQNIIYDVLNTHDSTINESMNYELLQEGSQYTTSDRLRFLNDKSRLLVKDEKGKTFIVKGDKNRVPKYLSYDQPTMGRPGKEIYNSIDLMNHFLHKGHYLILSKEEKVSIHPDFFKINQDSFFYIRLYWKGEQINKHLPHKNNALIINKTQLFTAQYKANEKYGKDTIVQIPEEQITRMELRCYGCLSNRMFNNPTLPEHLQGKAYYPIQISFLDIESIIEDIRKLKAIKKKALPEEIHHYLELWYGGKIDKKAVMHFIN